MAPTAATTDPTDDTRTADVSSDPREDWTPLANPRRVRV